MYNWPADVSCLNIEKAMGYILFTLVFESKYRNKNVLMSASIAPCHSKDTKFLKGMKYLIPYSFPPDSQH